MSFIIGVTGLAGAGKDTVGQHLVRKYGFTRRAFADSLKQLAVQINPQLEQTVVLFGWEMAKKIPGNREFLQNLGHGARQVFGDNFWINQVFVDMPERMVLTDLRYENEFERVMAAGGVVLRVTRPGLEPVNNHVTETGHATIPTDHTVVNMGSLAELYEQVDYIMQSFYGLRDEK